MTQHDDLDRQLLLLAKRQADQLEEANERQVEEGESHGSIFTVKITPTKVHVEGLGDIFGTHTVATASPTGTSARFSAGVHRVAFGNTTNTMTV